MIHYNVYPGGKRFCVTFSYDDGPANDERLIELFNEYGVKGTFHLNANKYLQMSEAELAAVAERYRGHEISCHTLSHGFLDIMPPVSRINEIMEDRKMLERIAGYPVCGMSYPFGNHSPEAVEALRACGIVYCRTVKSTFGFRMPDDYLLWDPTCHHKDALSKADAFLSGRTEWWSSKLFYVWGHSYEFRTEEDWAYMRELLERIARSEDTAYLTNMEIYLHHRAQKNLIISSDEKIIENPSAMDVWILRDHDVVCIPAGQTVRF